MMCRTSSWVFISCFAISVVACAGKTNSPSPTPAAVDSCRSGWDPLTSLRSGVFARQLIEYNGELLYFAFGTDQTARIEAQPIAGGQSRVVAQTGPVWDLWLRGDQLYYTWEGNVWKVPASGGTPVQLITHTPDTYSDPMSKEALSDTRFYWLKVYSDSSQVNHQEVWSAPLDGTNPESLFAVIEPAGVQRFDIVNNSLVIASYDPNSLRTGAVYPLDGSAPHDLASAATWNFIGLDSQALYATQWANETQQAMIAIPLDGGAPRNIWRNLPALVYPQNIWSDGNGRWLVSADEQFDDGLTHKALYFLAGDGTGSRTACNASSYNQDHDYIDVTAAFTTDAAFVIHVEDPESLYDPDASVNFPAWQIMRVPRPTR